MISCCILIHGSVKYIRILCSNKGKIMKIQKEFVLREIAGDYVIIPTGKTVLTFNGLITVNEVGAELWKMRSQM